MPLGFFNPCFSRSCWDAGLSWQSGPVCLHWAFTALLGTRRYWENVIYPCCAGSIQLKSQCRVVVLCQAHLSAIGTPQNFRNEWSSEGIMNHWPQPPFLFYLQSPTVPQMCFLSLLTSQLSVCSKLHFCQVDRNEMKDVEARERSWGTQGCVWEYSE